MRKGPGECLQIILETLGIHPHNCECRERAREMDELGAEKCREKKNFDRIVNWLRTEQAKRGWIEHLQTIAEAIRTGAAKSLIGKVNPIDPAPGLVTLAIQMSEEFSKEDPLQ